MAKKIVKPTPKIPKTFTESEVGVLIEHFGNNIKLIAEGQVAFREEVKSEFGKVWTEMGLMKQSMEQGFSSVWKEMGSMKAEMRTGFKEMDSRFKTVFEYLSRIDDELAEIKSQLKKLDETKVDRKEFNIIERRLAEAERAIEECKILLRAAKN